MKRIAERGSFLVLFCKKGKVGVKIFKVRYIDIEREGGI